MKLVAGEEESLKIKENCFKIVTKLGVLYQNKGACCLIWVSKNHLMIISNYSNAKG